MPINLLHPADGQTSGAARPWRLPAWLLSLVLHLAGMLVLALALRPGLPAPVEEAEREVGIVLTSRDAQQQVEYFDGDGAQSDSAAAKSALEAASSSSLQAALPTEAAAAELLPELPLPALAAGGVDVQVGSARVTPLARPQLFAGEGDEAILAEEAARRAAAAVSKGPPTRLSIFGSPDAVGNSFVFVIDRSKSMGSDGLGALSAAEQEFTAALAGLTAEHRFQVIAYNQQPVYVGARTLHAATPENKQAMKDFFKELAAYGGTQHETALLSALRLEPDVVFLLTDGGDPYLSEPQIDEITRRAARRTTIHCLQFGFGPAPKGNDFMQRLARRNHGSYGYIDMSARRVRSP